MNIVFKIARAELRTLFYSPIAWLVLLAFYVMGAAIISISLEKYANFQEVLLQMQPEWNGFDAGIGAYIFKMVIGKMSEYLYLFIPLLTMGLINREVVNGTSKLLYSSPVSTTEIVLGKFLGMVLFNMFILLVFAFVLFSLCIHVENADYNWALSILLGFFFVMNGFAAIGMFLSSITNYQIVSAMLTFVLFFVLSNITSVGQQYDLIRDITFALSMSGKGMLMIHGLITSRDVIYFLLIMFLFAGYTIIRLNSMQQSGSRLKVFARYGILTVLVVILGVISSRPGHIAYLDVTSNKTNTIHPVVQDALKGMDGSPLTVTLYTNLLGGNASHGLPQARTSYMMNLWEPFLRFYPEIRFRYEYYYDLMDGDSTYYRRYPGKNIHEIAAIEADINNIRTSIFKLPAEIRNEIKLEDEKKMLVMLLDYKGKKTWLRTYKDPTVWPGQEHVAAGIMRLTRPRDVRAVFVSGHYERSAFNNTVRDFYGHTTSKGSRVSLINRGVDVDTVSLPGDELNPATDILVVADPRSEYSNDEQEAIIKWLHNGGNAVIYTEPGKQHILAPVLKEIGIFPDKGIVVRPDKHETPVLFRNKLTKAGNYIAREPDMQLFQDYGVKGGRVVNDGVVSLSFTETNGFKIEPVITLDNGQEAWLENGTLVVDSATPVFSASEGDIKKQEYVLAVKLSRNLNGKEQKIIVSGDADFMNYMRMIGNEQIGVALYSYTLDNVYPAYANAKLPEDRFLKISSPKAKLMVKVYVYGISGLLLLTAIVLLVRRKRK